MARWHPRGHFHYNFFSNPPGRLNIIHLFFAQTRCKRLITFEGAIFASYRKTNVIDIYSSWSYLFPSTPSGLPLEKFGACAIAVLISATLTLQPAVIYKLNGLSESTPNPSLYLLQPMGQGRRCCLSGPWSAPSPPTTTIPASHPSMEIPRPSPASTSTQIMHLHSSSSLPPPSFYSTSSHSDK